MFNVFYWFQVQENEDSFHFRLYPLSLCMWLLCWFQLHCIIFIKQRMQLTCWKKVFQDLTPRLFCFGVSSYLSNFTTRVLVFYFKSFNVVFLLSYLPDYFLFAFFVFRFVALSCDFWLQIFPRVLTITLMYLAMSSDSGSYCKCFSTNQGIAILIIIDKFLFSERKRKILKSCHHNVIATTADTFWLFFT